MSTAGNIGGLAGAGIGAAFGAPQIGQGIGQAAGELVQPLLEEFSPSARAQRKMFRDARNRMKAGTYGFTEAQRQDATGSANQNVAMQQAMVQSDLARQQAGGTLTGGAATDARRAAYQAAAAGMAANANAVQQASDRSAQNQYAQDQAIIDAQADRARKFWQKDAAKPNTDYASMVSGTDLDKLNGLPPARLGEVDG